MSEKAEDDKTTEEKTPLTTPPATPPAPAADNDWRSAFESLSTKIDAAITGIGDAIAEATKTPPPPKEEPKTETVATKDKDSDSSPGTAEPKLHPWFKPLGAWGKGK